MSWHKNRVLFAAFGALIASCSHSNFRQAGEDCWRPNLGAAGSSDCIRVFGPDRYVLKNGDLAAGAERQAFEDAISGREDGHALLLALIADEADRAIAAEFLEFSNRIQIDPRATDSVTRPIERAAFSETRARLNSAVGRLAGGPVTEATLAQFVFMTAALKRLPDSINVQRVAQQLVQIDIALADTRDSFAQTRLGRRYLYGDGVEISEEKGASLLKSASKTTGGLRQCVYASGGTHCYSKNTLRAGNPEAAKLLCDYFMKHHAESEESRETDRWCKRS